MPKLGLIAGNGRFPFLVLEEAVKKGYRVVVAAIREETFPEIEETARSMPEGAVSIHWMGLGQLGRLLKVFKQEGIRQAVMAGQVKHVQIYAPSSVKARRLLAAMPDLKMAGLLMSLPKRNTSSLIGGVVRVLEKEGIELLDSTFLLQHLLPESGPVSRRQPNPQELKDFEFGRPLALELARLDVGQTLVIKDQAVVAVEAMEGTDDTIRRASRLVRGLPLTVIKVSRPRQDMRFDVPVIGLDTLQVLEQCNVSALAVDAGKTLLLDRQEFVARADRLGISIVAFDP